MLHVTGDFGDRNCLSIRSGEWTSERMGSSDGQLQLKKPMQECTHCQDTPISSLLMIYPVLIISLEENGRQLFLCRMASDSPS